MAQVLTESMRTSFDEKIAIGEYGTQLFWWNADDQKFEYALPLVSGGEYGGDTETFEAPELDLDYVPKISGRTTLEDITLTTNYTKVRYSRWLQILSNSSDSPAKYMEVFDDGSASIYAGTSGRPTIQGGDVRQIEVTIAPMNLIWVADINSLTASEAEDVNTVLDPTTDLATGDAIPVNSDTIPSFRTDFFRGTESV